MVTITCQHSGIEFEAETRRTKNHPAVSAAKITANKNGYYRQFDIAMAAVQSAGGYTTADEFVQRAEEIAQALNANLPLDFQVEEAEKLAVELSSDSNNDIESVEAETEPHSDDHNHILRDMVNAMTYNADLDSGTIEQYAASVIDVNLADPNGKQVAARKIDALRDSIRRGMRYQQHYVVWDEISPTGYTITKNAPEKRLSSLTTDAARFGRQRTYYLFTRS